MAEFLAMAEFRAGNWPGAASALDAACDTLDQLDLHGPLIASFADRSVIDAHRGDHRPSTSDRGRHPRRGRPRSLLADGLPLRAGRGRVLRRSHEAADRAWTAMREEARVVGWKDFLDDRSEPDHVEALVALGRLDGARRVLDHLEWRGRTLPRAWIDAGLPRARALILAAEGRVAEALTLLEEAPATPSLPFEDARLLLVRGQLERRANRKLAARDSLTRALETFGRLGSPPWVKRADTRSPGWDSVTATRMSSPRASAGSPSWRRPD